MLEVPGLQEATQAEGQRAEEGRAEVPCLQVRSEEEQGGQGAGCHGNRGAPGKRGGERSPVWDAAERQSQARSGEGHWPQHKDGDAGGLEDSRFCGMGEPDSPRGWVERRKGGQ